MNQEKMIEPRKKKFRLQKAERNTAEGCRYAVSSGRFVGSMIDVARLVRVGGHIVHIDRFVQRRI